jgi:RNA polymerase sigma-70 factor (ECF subfamily)
LSQLSDAVVAAAQGGDRSAMRVVYEVLAPRVLGYLRTKGVADPEAVTGDVFVAVFTQLHRTTGGAAGLTRFTFSIAHARMVDEHRARSRVGPMVSYDPDLDERSVESAEDAAAASISVARVRAVLAQLPEDQGEVLTLRIIADLTIDQIAQVMGRSPGAIKQLQRRAMISLRQVLAERQVTL